MSIFVLMLVTVEIYKFIVLNLSLIRPLGYENHLFDRRFSNASMSEFSDISD